MDIDFGEMLSEPASRPIEPEVMPALAVSPDKPDIRPIAVSLVPYEKLVREWNREAREIVVADAETQKAATAIASRSKKKKVELEADLKRIIAPYSDFVKLARNIYKSLTDTLEENISLAKGKLDQYAYKIELEQRRREAELREEQRQLQAKLDEEARLQREEAERKAREALEKLEKEEDEATRIALAKEVEEETAAAAAPTPVVAPIVETKSGVVRTSEGSSYQKFKWVHEVIDPELVPRECCSPDDKKIAALVRGGARQIPGCIIKEVAITHIRA